MKRVVIASIVVLMMIAVIAIGYFYYQQVQTPGSEAYDAIPHDAAIIVEIKHPRDFREKISASSQWNEIAAQANVKEIDHNMSFLDSISKVSQSLNELFDKNSVVLSFHSTKSTDFDVLYIVSMPSFKQESFINEIVYMFGQSDLKINKRIYNGVSIREFNYNNKTFIYSVYKGLFVGSHTAILVEDAIRQLKAGKSIKSDKSFNNVYEAAGKNVDAHVYVNYSNLPRFIFIYTQPISSIPVQRVHNFAKWTQLDVSIKKENFLLNGFTIASDTSQFLYTLKDQKAIIPTVFDVLPRRTALFQLTTVSDVPLYLKNLNTWLKKISFADNSELSTAEKAKFISWIGNEICYFITEASSINFNNNSFAAIKSSDISQARKILKEFGEKNNESGFKEELYRGKIIGFINRTGILPALLGPGFERINRFFYTYVDDFVIIGNQASSIRSIIDDNLSVRKLSAEQSFINFQKQLSNSSNFYSYINIPRSPYIIKSYATHDYFKSYTDNHSYLNKINAIALQLSGNGKMFYTNLSFDMRQQMQEGEINLLWATQLDTAVSMQPQLVINHNTNAYEIAVQDDAFNLYLIDNGGEILWKRKLDEKIISPIYQVDLFKNGKLQMMFNTSTRLFLIDRNRNNVGNYPIRLPAEATNAMSLYDYENTRDYRIFIACANGQVYSYLASGRPSAGWLFNRPTGVVTNPVRHFAVEGKDYLIISDNYGKFYMLDRRGAVRAEAKQYIYRPVLSDVFLAKNEVDRAYFVTTDSTGTIYSVFPDGNVYSKTITPFLPSHYFIFEDLNSDQVKDYIFVDDNKLYAFNKDNSPIFNYVFNNEINAEASFYQFSNGKGKVGIASVSANEIYLINDDGSMYDGFPLKGSTPYLITDLNNDGTKKIITASLDGNVYVYNFE